MKSVQLRIASRIVLLVLGVGSLWATGLTDDLFALRARHRGNNQRVSRANPRDGDHCHDFDLIRGDLPFQFVAQDLPSYRFHYSALPAEMETPYPADYNPREVVALPPPPVTVEAHRYVSPSRAPPLTLS